mgnify:CR=1 FL=1
MSAPEEGYTEAMFIEWLDDAYEPYTIGDLTFYASSILKDCDPIAYRIMYGEWVDMMEEEYGYAPMEE